MAMLHFSYFLNNYTKTTTWEDPRLTANQADQPGNEQTSGRSGTNRANGRTDEPDNSTYARELARLQEEQERVGQSYSRRQKDEDNFVYSYDENQSTTRPRYKDMFGNDDRPSGSVEIDDGTHDAGASSNQ